MWRKGATTCTALTFLHGDTVALGYVLQRDTHIPTPDIHFARRVHAQLARHGRARPGRRFAIQNPRRDFGPILRLRSLTPRRRQAIQRDCRPTRPYPRLGVRVPPLAVGRDIRHSRGSLGGSEKDERGGDTARDGVERLGLYGQETEL